MSEHVLEYWAKLQLSFHHHLNLSLIGGGIVVIYKLRHQIKRAWATISHSMFRVVARDTAFQVSLSHNSSFQIQRCSQRHGCPWACLWLVDSLKPSQVVDLPSFRLKVSLSYMRDTSSNRSLQLLSSIGWVSGNASRVPVLLVILKPSQVVDLSSFRLKVSLFYEGQFL